MKLANKANLTIEVRDSKDLRCRVRNSSKVEFLLLVEIGSNISILLICETLENVFPRRFDRNVLVGGTFG